MDPNAALLELRRIVSGEAYPSRDEDGAFYDAQGQAMRMAELFEGLDEWLSRGGFLPEDWSKGR